MLIGAQERNCSRTGCEYSDTYNKALHNVGPLSPSSETAALAYYIVSQFNPQAIIFNVVDISDLTGGTFSFYWITNIVRMILEQLNSN